MFTYTSIIGQRWQHKDGGIIYEFVKGARPGYVSLKGPKEGHSWPNHCSIQQALEYIETGAWILQEPIIKEDEYNIFQNILVKLLQAI